MQSFSTLLSTLTSSLIIALNHPLHMQSLIPPLKAHQFLCHHLLLTELMVSRLFSVLFLKILQSQDNSRPVLVETVKQPPPFDTRAQQKLKKPKAGGSSGIKIRVNSAKIARKKTKGRTSQESKKKEVAESFAIVLTSVDPERDFRESMAEMIVENKMKRRTDLEDLLACYLSLNSSEYHDIIIKAFGKTRSHLTHLT